METLKASTEMLIATCNQIAFKCFFALLYILYSFSFNVGHQVALISILVLIIFDFITGIFAAKFTGEEIKSSKVLKSAIKVALYFILISAGNLVENVVGLNLFADETIMGFLAATELISLIENIGRLGYAVPRKFLNKLHKFTDKQ